MAFMMGAATTDGPAHIGYEEGVLQLLLKQGT
jgi:hypothetical protein